MVDCLLDRVPTFGWAHRRLPGLECGQPGGPPMRADRSHGRRGMNDRYEFTVLTEEGETVNISISRKEAHAFCMELLRFLAPEDADE